MIQFMQCWAQAVRGGACGAVIAAAAALAVVCQPSPARSEAGLSIELNKLEQRQGACRAYLVVHNGLTENFETLKLDLVLFGSDGVISNRLALDAAPLPAGKTSVKPFDISGVECAGIGRVLLNDVLSCVSGGGSRDDCVTLVTTSTRATVPFVK